MSGSYSYVPSQSFILQQPNRHGIRSTRHTDFFVTNDCALTLLVFTKWFSYTVADLGGGHAASPTLQNSPRCLE